MSHVSLKPKNKNHSIIIERISVSHLWYYEITDNSKSEEDPIVVSHKTWDRSKVLKIIDRYADLDSPENQKIKKDIQINIDPSCSQEHREYMHHPIKQIRVKL